MKHTIPDLFDVCKNHTMFDLHGQESKNFFLQFKNLTHQ